MADIEIVVREIAEQGYREWDSGESPPTLPGVIVGAIKQALAHPSIRAHILQSAWRPIGEAPRNHFPVLVDGPYGRLVAFLDITFTWWPVPATKPLGYVPTHFQPLPLPPTGGEP